MHGSNALVTAGQVLYLGVSDAPAWIVVKAKDYVRANSLRTISMCRNQEMGIAPWDPLAQGRLRSVAARQLTGGGGSDGARNATLPAVAVAYLLHKSPYVFPIIGHEHF
ncbi:hypothetical protein BDV18DRAFT_161227 [Aspergillus unguis]